MASPAAVKVLGKRDIRAWHRASTHHGPPLPRASKAVAHQATRQSRSHVYLIAVAVSRRLYSTLTPPPTAQTTCAPSAARASPEPSSLRHFVRYRAPSGPPTTSVAQPRPFTTHRLWQLSQPHHDHLADTRARPPAPSRARTQPRKRPPNLPTRSASTYPEDLVVEGGTSTQKETRSPWEGLGREDTRTLDLEVASVA